MIGGVEFIEEGHQYIRDGINVPSLSSVLNYMQLDPNLRFYKPVHAQRGQYVHTLTELIDAGTLDWKTLDSRLTPYAEAYQSFTENESFSWTYTEQVLFNEILWYAGTMDRSGDFRDEETVMDIKSGNGGHMAKHGVQTAGYDLCLPGEPRKRWILFLRPNGTYKLEQYEDRDDYKAVQHGAWLLNWSRRVK